MSEEAVEVIEILSEPKPSPPTKEELLALTAKMQNLQETLYAILFKSNIGGEAHAMMEFTGLMGVYIDMCHAAAAKSIDFRHANAHTGDSLTMHSHQGKYLGEKLDCIFGPALRANPPAAKAFLTELGFARTSFIRTIGKIPVETVDDVVRRIDVTCRGCGKLESECDSGKATHEWVQCCRACKHEITFKPSADGSE